MKNRLPLFILLISILALCARSTIASSPQETAKASAARSSIVLPPEKAVPVNIPRFEKAPIIDGRLDDDAWKSAAVFKDFYQRRPGENIPGITPEVSIAMISSMGGSAYFPHAFFRFSSSFITSDSDRVLKTSAAVSQPRRATFTPNSK